MLPEGLQFSACLKIWRNLLQVLSLSQTTRHAVQKNKAGFASKSGFVFGVIFPSRPSLSN